LYLRLESDVCNNIRISDIEVFEIDDAPTPFNICTKDLFSDEILYESGTSAIIG